VRVAQPNFKGKHAILEEVQSKLSHGGKSTNLECAREIVIRWEKLTAAA
jgi:hypothetical protein